MRRKGRGNRNEAEVMRVVARDVTILLYYYMDYPIAQISKLLGCHESYPAIVARRYGLPRRGYSKKSKRY